MKINFLIIRKECHELDEFQEKQRKKEVTEAVLKQIEENKNKLLAEKDEKEMWHQVMLENLALMVKNICVYSCKNLMLIIYLLHKQIYSFVSTKTTYLLIFYQPKQYDIIKTKYNQIKVTF